MQVNQRLLERPKKNVPYALQYINKLHLEFTIHRQYDVSNTSHPKLTGQIFLGGSITKEFGAKVTQDTELEDQPQARYVKG